MPVWTQWLSLILATIGSISGLYALALNHQRTTITKRKERERLEEKKKAKFSIERTKEMGSKRPLDKFLLHNKGQAEARNVGIEFYNYNRKGDGKKRKINVLADTVPSKVDAGQTINMPMMIASDTAPPYEIVITWDDDFKIGNVSEISLH